MRINKIHIKNYWMQNEVKPFRNHLIDVKMKIITLTNQSALVQDPFVPICKVGEGYIFWQVAKQMQ